MSSRMPVSEPPITPPPTLLSRNSTRRGAASRDGAVLRASRPCVTCCIAAAESTTRRRRWSTNRRCVTGRDMQSVAQRDPQHEVERVQPETVRHVGAWEVLGILLEALCRPTRYDGFEQRRLVEGRTGETRLE